MLEIERLSYAYPQAAGDSMQFDLRVGAGEILSLVGPSGAGKSTLLHLIAGFLDPQDGHIRVDGEPIETLPSAERPVTMVFQENNLFPHLDLYTNVGLGIDPSMKLSASQQQALAAAFERLGLDGLERRKPGEVSGGQRQRAALARALVRQRRVLLLDEAFAALGPALRQELIELVASLVLERDMAALLVSHQPRDALIASARTAFVCDGRILTLEPTAELLQDSTRPEVRGYLGSL